MIHPFISDILDIPQFASKIQRVPLNYWDFPVAALTFCESLSFSKPIWINDCLYRQAGKKGNTLVTYADPKYIVNCKSLNFTDARILRLTPPIHQRGPVEYRIGEEYLKKIASNKYNSATVRNLHRKGASLFSLEASPHKPTDVLEVFTKWRTEALTRHFMVFVGHYLRWLKYSLSGNDSTVQLRVAYDAAGTPLGLFGWEYFRGMACVTVAKTAPAHNSLPTWLWLAGIQAIFENAPYVIDQVFCGSTADQLKTALEFTPYPSWEIKRGIS